MSGINFRPPATVRDRTLDAARAAVTGRPDNYGSPRVNFARIAALWSVILDRPVTPAEVALCMVALKVARLVTDEKHGDGWIDLAGYAACGAEVAGAEP